MRLKDVQVRNAKPLDKPYKLHDGMGMYLLVTPSGDGIIDTRENERPYLLENIQQFRLSRQGSFYLR